MNRQDVLSPADLGLILSYKCQSNCAHCLYNCGSDWEEWITEADIEKALHAALVWKSRFQVHLTGGEPFLNFPLLKHAVKVCDELRIPVYLETNAGWCVSDELTRRRFMELKQTGLQAVLISCSPFHAESIPPERVLRAVEHANAVFSSSQVIVYQYSWMGELLRKGITSVTPLEEYIAHYGKKTAGKLFWEGYGLISGGRAGFRLGHLTSRYPAESFKDENCHAEILFAPHSHFDLYGNFIPGFCGGISLGSWNELPDLIQNYQKGIYPRLIKLLLEKGPFGLFPLARESGYTQLTQGYAGKCHLCVDLRAHLLRSGHFPELEPAGFYSGLGKDESN